MAIDYAASILGAALRITRLQADGSLATGASASYITNSFISVSFTPEYEDGDEFTQKNAAGEVCVTYKAPDTLKRVTLEISVCDPDPVFTEIAGGGTLLETAGEVLGYASPEVGVDAMPYGAALEVFSNAIVAGKPASTNRYWHWVFPYVVLRPSGDRVFEGGILANTFEGWGTGNSMFGTGPGDPSWPFISDRPYQYARTNALPTGSRGYYTIV